jgi:hypothetical protein
MTKAQFAKEGGYSEGSGSSDAAPVDADDDVATDTDEERSAPPPALNALFTKEADEIEQQRQEWSHYTAEQCRRAGKISIEKKRKSPARDANYKMANGGAPENDLQQFGSGGGKASMKKKKESPARDANYKMANGGRCCCERPPTDELKRRQDWRQDWRTCCCPCERTTTAK